MGADGQFAQFTILCRFMGNEAASWRKPKLTGDGRVLICLPATVNQITLLQVKPLQKSKDFFQLIEKPNG
jgi:hypothetical protein